MVIARCNGSWKWLVEMRHIVTTELFFTWSPTNSGQRQFLLPNTLAYSAPSDRRIKALYAYASLKSTRQVVSSWSPGAKAFPKLPKLYGHMLENIPSHARFPSKRGRTTHSRRSLFQCDSVAMNLLAEEVIPNIDMLRSLMVCWVF